MGSIFCWMKEIREKGFDFLFFFFLDLIIWAKFGVKMREGDR